MTSPVSKAVATRADTPFSKLVGIPSLMNATEWVRLEVRVFFSLVIFGSVFIFFSFLRKPNNIIEEIRKKAAPKSDDNFQPVQN